MPNDGHQSLADCHHSGEGKRAREKEDIVFEEGKEIRLDSLVCEML